MRYYKEEQRITSQIFSGISGYETSRLNNFISENSLLDNFLFNHNSVLNDFNGTVIPPLSEDLGYATDNKYFLVDTNIDSRPMGSLKFVTFTTAIVAQEGKWENRLCGNHILDTYTCADLKKFGYATLTLATTNGFFESTVSYKDLTIATNEEIVLCQHCHGECTATLTSDSGTIAYVCSRLSKADQSLLIYAVAFSNILTLITNEGCLGWSSRNLSSFSQEKDIQKYWNNQYK